MKKINTLPLLCLFLTACSDKPTTPLPTSTPVDMEYNVDVEVLEDSCGENPIPEGLNVALSVVLQTDGSMTVAYPFGNIPGYGFYEGLKVKDNQASGPTIEPGDPLLTVTGELTMDTADLVFEGQRLLVREDGSVTMCPGTTRVHLYGNARPLWDKSVLDGKYVAHYDFYGLICPPDEPNINNAVPWTVPLDVGEHNNTALFGFDSHDERLSFLMPTDALASGSVNWSGPMVLSSRGYGYDLALNGEVTGTFQSEEEYNISLKFTAEADGDVGSCRYVLDIKGSKLLPDTTSVPNVYRVAFLKSDTCRPDANGNPMVENLEGYADILQRKDGGLAVMHGVQRFDLPPQDNGTYSGHWANSSLTLDYTAYPMPPNMDLLYSWGKENSDGPCEEAYTGVGVPRYFPELELKAPDTNRAKPLRVSSTSAIKGLTKVNPRSLSAYIGNRTR